MSVIGSNSVFQRTRRSLGNSIPRVAKPAFVLPSSAALIGLLAACPSTWAAPTLTTLVNFDQSNGYNPIGGLIPDAAGNLYGTTPFITGNFGTVFQIAAGTHAFSMLAQFNNANGAEPVANLSFDAAGNLYGTTLRGGANNVGTVFQIAAGTHVISTITTFTGNNGAYPASNLIADAAGNMYGTTEGGGAFNDGTVFKIAAGTHALSTVASFDGSNGSTPFGGLIADAAGNMYGTTAGATNINGTVFEIAAGTQTLSVLTTFNIPFAHGPRAGLIADGAGDLFGTTPYGGTSDFGTVFEIAAGSRAFSTLVNFNNTNGARPYATLISDAAGNLYGTSNGDGMSDFGTIFEVAAGTHALSTLATFNGSNGLYPYAGLTSDGAGNLYGTAEYGGANSVGTVFELTKTGFVTAPEPASMSLIGFAGLGLLARRRPAWRK